MSDSKLSKTFTLTKSKDQFQFKPFIEEQEKLNDTFRTEADASLAGTMSVRAPLNKAIIKAAEHYRDQLPDLLRENLASVRAFFLNELAPLLLATSNGLLDAKEVLTVALEEEPAVSLYFNRIEKAVDAAVEVKIRSFVSKLAGLTSEQNQQFLLVTLSKEPNANNEHLSRLLHEVLQIPDVQKPVKGTKVQLRRLQKDEERGVDPGAGRAGARSKRGG